MLKSFFDEGGITKQDRAAVFAGFMGDETACDSAALKWADIVKPIGEFHATEFFSRGPLGRMLGRYSHLNSDEADAVVMNLVDLLYESKLEPIGLAIDAEVFRTLSEDERRWMTSAVVDNKTWPSQGSPKNPQFACFSYCLTEANKFTRPEEKMFVTCAHTTVFENTMSRIYADFLVVEDSAGERGDRLADTIIFSTPSECFLLQAADLLAFVMGKNVIQEKINNSVIQYALEKLALQREFVGAMDQKSIDMHLRRHPFRTTFWKGMTEPDYLEELRIQGIEVLASKVGGGIYRTHKLSPKNLQLLGKAGAHRVESLNRTQCLSDETKNIEVAGENKIDSPQDSQSKVKDQSNGK